MSRNIWIGLTTLPFMLAGTARGADIGTAFTYQGFLEKPVGTPVTGTCDLEFSLWDDGDPALPESQIGPTLTFDGVGGNPPPVSVTAGVFTLALDFGDGTINGTARWLAIKVCCPSGCALEPLTPRVELTPAPHALALPGLYTQQNGTSPNVVGGFSGNTVTLGVVGATIAGGGRTDDGFGPPDNNRVTDEFGTIGGGRGNQAGDGAGTTSDRSYATVGGGLGNTASDEWSTIGGGNTNTASGLVSTVGGGRLNLAGGFNSTVGGGLGNSAFDQFATVGGGQGNIASASSSSVGGGSGNTASDSFSTVGGGYQNDATGVASSVGGGELNTVSGDSATVGGGTNNTASALFATVPGGYVNSAGGQFSLAAGQLAKVRTAQQVGGGDMDGDEGTFVWGDSTNADFTSTGPNQFLIRATGGMRLATGDGTTPQFQAVLPSLTGSPHVPEDLALQPLGGNVGIGTNSPANQLDVEGRAAIGATYSGTSAAPDNGLIIEGNVGIGTTTPANKLDVEGSVALGVAYSGSVAAPTNGLIVEGNVGIGTSSPGTTLTVAGAANTGAGSASMELNNSTAGTGRRYLVGSSTNGLFQIADLSAGSATRLVVDPSGDVGIGTNSPGAHALQVTDDSNAIELVQFNSTVDLTAANDILALETTPASAIGMQFIECSRGADIEFAVNGDGSVLADGTYSGPADFAEVIKATEGADWLEPGDVLIIDVANPRAVIKSKTARSKLVAGVYSTKPGFLGSEHDWDQVERQILGLEAGVEDEAFLRDRGLLPRLRQTIPQGRADASEPGLGMPTVQLAKLIGEVPVSVVGIVPCKVSTENGAIRPGDLLVTASTPGHAMREDNPRPGTVLGKSLGFLENGTGLVKVLVSLH